MDRFVCSLSIFLAEENVENYFNIKLWDGGLTFKHYSTVKKNKVGNESIRGKKKFEKNIKIIEILFKVLTEFY
jgi:hypothetical protein